MEKCMYACRNKWADITKRQEGFHLVFVEMCVFDMSLEQNSEGQLWSLGVSGSCKKYYHNFLTCRRLYMASTMCIWIAEAAYK